VLRRILFKKRFWVKCFTRLTISRRSKDKILGYLPPSFLRESHSFHEKTVRIRDCPVITAGKRGTNRKTCLLRPLHRHAASINISSSSLKSCFNRVRPLGRPLPLLRTVEGVVVLICTPGGLQGGRPAQPSVSYAPVRFASGFAITLIQTFPAFHAAPDKPFHAAPGRPVDAAQGRPFHTAQDRPFDMAPGRQRGRRRGGLVNAGARRFPAGFCPISPRTAPNLQRSRPRPGVGSARSGPEQTGNSVYYEGP